MLVEAELLGGGDQTRLRIEQHGLLVGIDGAMRFDVVKFDLERRAVGNDFQFAGGNAQCAGFFGELPAGDVPRGLLDGPGVIALGQVAKKGRADADEIGRQDRNANLGAVGTSERDGGIRFNETRHGADRAQAVQVDGRRAGGSHQDAESGCQ